MRTTRGDEYTKYDNDKYVEMILPTELASGFINNDWSFLDYFGDEWYTDCVNQLCQDLEHNGLYCVDVMNDDGFCKYHDMSDYGVLATNCSSFVFRK